MVCLLSVKLLTLELQYCPVSHYISLLTPHSFIHANAKECQLSSCYEHSLSAAYLAFCHGTGKVGPKHRTLGCRQCVYLQCSK